MRWFQNNLPGLVLACASGGMLLMVLIMALLWRMPVSTEITPDPEAGGLPEQVVASFSEIGPLGQFSVVTDRPLFNPSRRPELIDEEGDEDELVIEEGEVADAPDVKLTGVVITPEIKVVSLTPSGGGEPLVIAQGQPMQGEYNGWRIEDVSARNATLVARNGSRVDLALVVHDQRIIEPPKPKRPAAESDEDMERDLEEDDDDEPVSRAEEIRQRIAERREQLRQEAEERESAGQGTKSPANYSEAISNMINQGKKQEENTDDDSR